MATAVAVPAAIVTAVLVASLASPTDSDDEPADRPPPTAAVTVAPPGGDPAAAPACDTLLAALPDRVGDLAPRTVESPSPAVGAWGDPAIVLRCGVPRPPELGPASPTIVVNGVEWYVDDTAGDHTTWTTVDRGAVYVEVAVPTAEPGSAVIADVASAVGKTLPPG